MVEKSKNVCEEDVFNHVFNTYIKDVRRFIYSKTRDLELAEDIVQDTFVKIWENCETVIFDKVKNFLFTIANNLFLNITKHNKVKHNYIQNNTNTSTNQSPEFLLLEEEFLHKLEETIASLPETQREVFLLSRIEKMKYKDIATQLGISIKAVEKRMHKALIIMREEIGDI